MTLRLRILLALVILAAACDDDDDDNGNPDAAAGAPDAAAGAPDSGAQETTFEVTLTREEEVPVCDAAGGEATGSATVTISADESMITVDLTYMNLSGPATAAHIHPGAIGVAGPPLFPFDTLTSPINQTFTAADYPDPPPAGAPADFAAAVAAMKAGQMYINVHTEACPPGEIRAQID